MAEGIAHADRHYFQRHVLFQVLLENTIDHLHPRCLDSLDLVRGTIHDGPVSADQPHVFAVFGVTDSVPCRRTLQLQYHKQPRLGQLCYGNVRQLLKLAFTH